MSSHTHRLVLRASGPGSAVSRLGHDVEAVVGNCITNTMHVTSIAMNYSPPSSFPRVRIKTSCQSDSTLCFVPQ